MRKSKRYLVGDKYLFSILPNQKRARSDFLLILYMVNYGRVGKYIMRKSKRYERISFFFFWHGKGEGAFGFMRRSLCVVGCVPASIKLADRRGHLENEAADEGSKVNPEPPTATHRRTRRRCGGWWALPKIPPSRWGGGCTFAKSPPPPPSFGHRSDMRSNFDRSKTARAVVREAKR
jgi:hypothetical protein